ncbi:hypothetical protein GUITHDRAFT_135380 [Guillardia theta CCMP2712]|uniref:Origin recognition complex-associated protein n=3 Tax=Guillardia theta TaxID=55529 RepID=L1JPL2_GUITC|nr:hypothetical protein GUITHDRAFT_135380 [Guillardia theta CCMP2712]EKX50209.1 hypothetical protein GUITHDRAFT_135380 [Guillardia theta CCMP2712]|eukprot:XP_005837189.1 hypothetical protein GUITHDRAFT_135380 [Guillardia theta CCMP2712]
MQEQVKARALACAMSRDGRLVVCTGKGSSVQVWKKEEEEWKRVEEGVKNMEKGHQERVTSIAFIEDEAVPSNPPMVATASADRTVKLWRLVSMAAAPSGGKGAPAVHGPTVLGYDKRAAVRLVLENTWQEDPHMRDNLLLLVGGLRRNIALLLDVEEAKFHVKMVEVNDKDVVVDVAFLPSPLTSHEDGLDVPKVSAEMQVAELLEMARDKRSKLSRCMLLCSHLHASRYHDVRLELKSARVVFVDDGTSHFQAIDSLRTTGKEGREEEEEEEERGDDGEGEGEGKEKEDSKAGHVSYWLLHQTLVDDKNVFCERNSLSHSEAISCLDLRSTRRSLPLLASGGHDRRVKLWSPSSREEGGIDQRWRLLEVLDAHEGHVCALKFSEVNGRLLVSSDMRGNVVCWGESMLEERGRPEEGGGRGARFVQVFKLREELAVRHLSLASQPLSDQLRTAMRALLPAHWTHAARLQVEEEQMKEEDVEAMELSLAHLSSSFHRGLALYEHLKKYARKVGARDFSRFGRGALLQERIESWKIQRSYAQAVNEEGIKSLSKLVGHPVENILRHVMAHDKQAVEEEIRRLSREFERRKSSVSAIVTRLEQSTGLRKELKQGLVSFLLEFFVETVSQLLLPLEPAGPSGDWDEHGRLLEEEAVRALTSSLLPVTKLREEVGAQELLLRAFSKSNSALLEVVSRRMEGLRSDLVLLRKKLQYAEIVASTGLVVVATSCEDMPVTAGQPVHLGEEEDEEGRKGKKQLGVVEQVLQRGAGVFQSTFAYRVKLKGRETTVDVTVSKMPAQFGVKLWRLLPPLHCLITSQSAAEHKVVSHDIPLKNFLSPPPGAQLLLRGEGYTDGYVLVEQLEQDSESLLSSPSGILGNVALADLQLLEHDFLQVLELVPLHLVETAEEVKGLCFVGPSSSPLLVVTVSNRLLFFSPTVRGPGGKRLQHVRTRTQAQLRGRAEEGEFPTWEAVEERVHDADIVFVRDVSTDSSPSIVLSCCQRGLVSFTDCRPLVSDGAADRLFSSYLKQKQLLRVLRTIDAEMARREVDFSTLLIDTQRLQEEKLSHLLALQLSRKGGGQEGKREREKALQELERIFRTLDERQDMVEEMSTTLMSRLPSHMLSKQLSSYHVGKVLEVTLDWMLQEGLGQGGRTIADHRHLKTLLRTPTMSRRSLDPLKQKIDLEVIFHHLKDTPDRLSLKRFAQFCKGRRLDRRYPGELDDLAHTLFMGQGRDNDENVEAVELLEFLLFFIPELDESYLFSHLKAGSEDETFRAEDWLVEEGEEEEDVELLPQADDDEEQDGIQEAGRVTEALVRAVDTNAIQVLDLSKFKLSSPEGRMGRDELAAIHDLFSSIAACTSLKYLSVDYQQELCSFDFFWRSLALNSSIHELSLQNLQLDRRHAGAIARCLDHNTTLRNLDLSHNNLTRGLGTIASSLADNQSLLCLDLSENNLDDVDISDLLDGLSYNRQLKSLWMNGNKILQHGFQQITRCLESRNFVVEKFSAFNQAIDREGNLQINVCGMDCFLSVREEEQELDQQTCVHRAASDSRCHEFVDRLLLLAAGQEQDELQQFILDNFTSVLDIPILPSVARRIVQGLRSHLELIRVRGYRQKIDLLLAPEGIRARRSKMAREAARLKELVEDLRRSSSPPAPRSLGRDLLRLSPLVSLQELPESVAAEKLQALACDVEDPEDAALLLRLYSPLSEEQGSKEAQEQGQGDKSTAESLPKEDAASVVDEAALEEGDDVVLSVLGIPRGSQGKLLEVNETHRAPSASSSSSSFFHNVSLQRSFSASSFRTLAEQPSSSPGPLAELVRSNREVEDVASQETSWGRIVRAEKNVEVHVHKLVRLGRTTWTLEDLSFLPWDQFKGCQAADEEEEEEEEEDVRSISETVQHGRRLALAALDGSSAGCLGWLDMKIFELVGATEGEERRRRFALMTLLSSDCKQGAYRTSVSNAGRQEEEQRGGGARTWEWNERFRFALPGRSCRLMVEVFEEPSSGTSRFVGRAEVAVEVHSKFVVFDGRAVKLSVDQVSRDQARCFLLTSPPGSASTPPTSSVRIQLCCRLLRSLPVAANLRQWLSNRSLLQFETGGRQQPPRIQGGSVGERESCRGEAASYAGALSARNSTIDEEEVEERDGLTRLQAEHVSSLPLQRPRSGGADRAPTWSQLVADGFYVSTKDGRVCLEPSSEEARRVTLRHRVLSALRSAAMVLEARRRRARPVSRWNRASMLLDRWNEEFFCHD